MGNGVTVLGLPFTMVLGCCYETFTRSSSGFWPGSKISSQIPLIIIVSGISIFAQIQINQLPFFFKYTLQFSIPAKDAVAFEYFNTTHFSRINYDFLKAGKKLEKIDDLAAFQKLEEDLSPNEVFNLLEVAQQEVNRRNYYWFPKDE